ncbi:MAG TPA: hypothetical protein VE291_00895 [Terracidiphilus sp.]|jgi:hypothetical protein|nr:hypothetical protein [Terracidiphilus sp.]
MNRVTGVAAVVLGCVAGVGAAQARQAVITLPAGAKVEMAVTAPVQAKSAKAGDSLYMQTTFPVVSGGGVAIPPGTYVQGELLGIVRPTRRVKHAELQVLFTKIIFANGYTVALPPATGSADGIPATAATITAKESTANDLLLDNGAQLEMTLAAPVALDSAQITAALSLTRPLAPGAMRSATQCRPTSGTPGSPASPDTVIPGSPGTPSTTIPGAPGTPDITIPGTPATPDTVIPGTPGTPDTPGTSCPNAPIVTASEPLALTPAASRSAASSPPAH